jgi:hypothetical protein
MDLPEHRWTAERGRQDFDGDVAVQPSVAGAEDLAHAAFAQSGEDDVRPEAIADHRRAAVCGFIAG